jgi:hypothetical protein
LKAYPRSKTEKEKRFERKKAKRDDPQKLLMEGIVEQQLE